MRDVDTARRQRLISEAEVAELKAAAQAVAAAVAVDDFAPAELTGRHAQAARWTAAAAAPSCAAVRGAHRANLTARTIAKFCCIA